MLGMIVRSAFLAAGLVATTGAPALAEPGTVTWTTFLYDAPSPAARVVDEPPQGARIEIETCTQGWCRATLGRTAGYLREDVVARGGAPAALANPTEAKVTGGGSQGPCFVAGLAVAEPPAPTRFCPK